MATHELKKFFDYNEWANARMFEALSTIDRDRLTQPVVSSFSSIRDTLAHIVAVEWVWLERWSGISPGALPEWAVEPELETLREKLDSVERARARFLESLDDEALERPVAYRNLKGAEHQYRLVELMQHLVNHSTYHRGQLTTQLRQLGVKPPSTDLLEFLASK